MNLNKITFLILVFLPLFLYAQKEGKLIKKSKWETLNSVTGSDNIIRGTAVNHNLIELPNGFTASLIKTSKTTFAVATINSSMEFGWQNDFSGIPLGINWFKGKLLVISAASKKSSYRNFINKYYAHLIDPDNGKIIKENLVYEGSSEYVEIPNLFFSDKGEYFKFSVLQSKKKGEYQFTLAPLSPLVDVNYLKHRFADNASFNIYQVNENLEVQSFTPILPEGSTVAGSIANIYGDIFVFTFKDKRIIQVSQYKNNNEKAVKTIEQELDVELSDFLKKEGMIRSLHYSDSKRIPDQIYWSTIIYEKKRSALYLSVLDFERGVYKSQIQYFDMDTLKKLYENYKPVALEKQRPVLSNPLHLDVHNLFELGDKVFVAIGGTNMLGTQSMELNWSQSEILNAFDSDLRLKYQQVIPRSYPHVNILDFSRIAYSHTEDQQKLRFICNTFSGFNGNAALYGVMDVNTGKLEQIKLLKKSKITARAYVNGTSVIWKNNGFIIPYFEPKGMVKRKYDIFIKQYIY